MEEDINVSGQMTEEVGYTNCGPEVPVCKEKKALPEFPESYTDAEVADMIAKVNVDIVTDCFLIKPLKLNTHVITMSDGSSQETPFGYQRGIVLGKGYYEYVNGPSASNNNSKFDKISIGDVVYYKIYSDAFDSENSMCEALLLDAYLVKAVEKVK